MTHKTVKMNNWSISYINIKPTSIICPFSEENIVFSMLVLKFHLRIDIKELSLSTSRVGKDLSKDDINFLLIKKDLVPKALNSNN
jgi:hypothetical protein